MSATKYDQGKPRMSLLSGKWLEGVAGVLTFGAQKYDAHNWRKGFPTSRLFDALLRHLMAWNEGEDRDPESGLYHLDHAACCLMFLQHQMLTKPELDNRYKEIKAD